MENGLLGSLFPSSLDWNGAAAGSARPRLDRGAVWRLGESPGFIPTRYPGTQDASDNSLKLARKTDWVAKGNALYVGLGQRMLATEQSEFALTEARKIELTQP